MASLQNDSALDAGAAVRAARLRAGLSQAELAHRTGTSQAAVSDIERGRREPTVEKFDLILRQCGHRLVVEFDGHHGVDPHDAELLRLNLELTPAERLAQMGRMLRLRGLARG